MNKKWTALFLARALVLRVGCGAAASNQTRQADAPGAPERESAIISISSEPTSLDPCQGWGLKNPGLSPPDPTRTSITEAQPNLSCEDSPLESRQAWAPRHLGRGHHPLF